MENNENPDVNNNESSGSSEVNDEFEDIAITDTNEIVNDQHENQEAGVNQNEKEVTGVNQKKAPKREITYYSAGKILSRNEKLTHDDVWKLPKHCSSDFLYKTFHGYWKEELKKNNPSLLYAVAKTVWKEFVISVVFFVLYSLLSFVLPLILPHMVAFIADPSQPYYLGYIYTSAVVVSTVLASFCYYRSQWFGSLFGLKVRFLFMTSVYRKSLKVTKLQGSSTGKIVNLYAADSQFVFDTTFLTLPAIAAPVPLIGTIIALGFYVGWYCLIALGVFIVAFLISTLLATKVTSYRLAMQACADDRLKLSTELIQGIRIVKYYAWERPFMKTINTVREIEIEQIKKLALTRAGLMFVIYGAPTVAVALIFLFYGIFEGEVTASIAFTVLALMNLSRTPFQWLAIGYNLIAVNWGSLQRIGAFLQVDNKVKYIKKSKQIGRVRIKDANFSWNESREPTLSDIDLKVENKEKVFIVGHVGSGKTSFALSIVGEIPKVSGSISIGGSVAYVPQQAWIFNASVRDNILFGEPFDNVRYKKVIHAAALQRDIEMMDAGDMTEIGERGVNLSGGQRQRISIARALYSNKDVYLFDDPLSAVDPQVSSHLFKNAIMGYLKNKTVIMVTNQLQYLPKADRIVMINHGKFVCQGNYAELIEKNENFKSLMDKFGVMEENKKEKEEKQVPKEKNLGDQVQKGTDDEDKEKGKLIKVEQRQKGLIPLKIYFYYIKAGGWFWFVIMAFGFVSFSVIRIMGTWWLAQWTQAANSGSSYDSIYWSWSYVLWTLAEAVLIVFSLTIGLVIFSINASRSLHTKLIKSIVKAVTVFFDITPVGRILSRLSQDLTLVDFLLSVLFIQWMAMTFFIITTLAGIGLGSWYIMLAILPLFLVYFFLQRYFKKTYIELQRLESISNAPPISHMSATLSGLESIRSYYKIHQFKTMCNKLLDYNGQEKYALKYCLMWYGIRLDAIGAIAILFVFLGISLVRNYSYIDPAFAGITMSFTSGLIAYLANFSFFSAEVEIRMNSIERFWEYNHNIVLGQEDAPDGFKPDPTWPSEGELKFKNFSFKYRQGPTVLKNLNFTIPPKTKVGLVGRTGAGKSSMLQALFRIEEPAEGTILIDGIDFTRVGLFDLRSSLAIIPQEPTMFLGTLRYNLDPFDEHSDDKIWNALEMVQLKDSISSNEEKLDYIVEENGSNFSVGQRQLICLARALLRNSSILLLDEATASVDVETDTLIQSTIRKSFSNCTVITIAHRLNTIMDSDMIVVLDKGTVVEYDKPINLLRKRSGYFYHMVRATGHASAKYLYKIAEGSLRVVDVLAMESKKKDQRKKRKSKKEKKQSSTP